MERLPKKSNRNVSTETVLSSVGSYLNIETTYGYKLCGYMMMKYCGLSTRNCAIQLGISHTNMVFHIKSVAHWKKKDPEFLELYNKIEQSILLRTNGVRKRIMYRKYNKDAKQSEG